MGFRQFRDQENAVATEWAEAATSGQRWTLGEGVGDGEAASVYVTADSGLRGVAKLDERSGTPRSAHEKIAADLAYALEIPVPPVTLWTSADNTRYSISLFAFPQALTWRNAVALRTPDFLAKVAPPLTATFVFHNWIGDTDHAAHDGNLLIDGDSDPTSPAIAAIDHAFSMTYSWSSRPTSSALINPYYVERDQMPKDVLRETVTRVQQLSKDLITSVVERVPTVYLSPDRATLIKECLIERQGRLDQIFGL